MSESDPTHQFWGIKDLLISARICHPQCKTCFGPTAGECKTCAPGYYLWGNFCVPKCHNLVLIDQNLCVDKCPLSTYET